MPTAPLAGREAMEVRVARSSWGDEHRIVAQSALGIVEFEPGVALDRFGRVNGVAEDLKAGCAFGTDGELAAQVEGVFLDANILMDGGVRNRVARVDVDGGFPAVVEAVAANAHVAHAAGFIPTDRVVFDQDSRHVRGVEIVVLHEHRLPSGDEKSASGNVRNLAAADFHGGRPCHVFEHVVFPKFGGERVL